MLKLEDKRYFTLYELRRGSIVQHVGRVAGFCVVRALRFAGASIALRFRVLILAWNDRFRRKKCCVSLSDSVTRTIEA